ncbi:uncharacterized protein LOC122962385 [Acropora millepora]|uniref:uncharacterized protein LOC122962385 n=1 Tax=Acropora millepora TaxID=45264 RepID=UPI001CF4D5A8|nr:uncharacterized protein LOC122962385 [Acropora millepora]
MAEQMAEGAKMREVEENVSAQEILKEYTVKQFADVGTETDPIIEAPVKTLVDVGTQTEPLVELTLERQQRNVALDHAYSRKQTKQDVDPKNVETKVELDFLNYAEDSDLSDESDEESCVDVDDAGSVSSCDDSDEDWKPEANEDSDDENADFVDYPNNNWLAESEESAFNESKSIVFDSCLKQLFRHCKMCSSIVKIAYLKQRGSLICVTTVCKAGHTEPWFSQPFTKGMAAGNLFVVVESFLLGITSRELVPL